MDTAALTSLYDVDGPVASLYLAAPSDTEDAAQQYDLRWRDALRTLEDLGVDEATCSAISDSRGTHVAGGTRVVIAAGGRVRLAVSPPGLPPRELVTVGSLPRLVPFLEARQDAVPHVVVLTDRTGAEVFAVPGAGGPSRTTEVQSRRWPLHKTGTGGWSAKRYDATVHDNWHENAKDVAAAAQQAAHEVGARVVVAIGDPTALSLLKEHLPAELADTTVLVQGGGRHADGSDQENAALVEQALEERRAHDLLVLLEEYAERVGRADRIADGPVDVLAAAREARIATLVLADTRDAEATALVGPQPHEIASTAEELADLGATQVREASLEEALVRATLCSGGEVRFVTGGTEQAPRDGYGALLRF